MKLRKKNPQIIKEASKEFKNDLLFHIAITVIYKFLSVARASEAPIKNPTEGYNRIQISTVALYNQIKCGKATRKQLMRLSADIASNSIRFMIDVTMLGSNDTLKNTINSSTDEE